MSAASAGASDNWIGSVAMTDDRPEPKYGQYAPVPPAPPVVEADPVPAPAPVAPQAEVAVRPRRTWDVVLTTLLLLVGVYDVVTSFGAFANLGMAMRVVYEQQGFGTFTSDELASAMGLVANVLRIGLLVAAIVVSLVRIGHNRIAFWVPLGAGVLAVLAVTVCVLVAALGDPALMEYVRNMQP